MSGVTSWFESHANVHAFAILAGFVVAAIVVEVVYRRLTTVLTARTRTDLDDEIAAYLRHPIATTVVLVGVHYALVAMGRGPTFLAVADAALVTLAVVIWTNAALRVAGAVARRTKTELDDEVVKMLRVPIAVTVVLIGVRVVFSTLTLSDGALYVAHALLVTAGVLVWTRAGVRVGKGLLNALGTRGDRFRLIEPRTLPLFDIVLHIVAYLGAAYAILLAWRVDVTAWLASAGIVGIAVGFAAKDTLANLFAGIFIIADAPYKVGDYINLDSGERGKVTNIGIRSTRILTRDDVEVTIPNSALGNAKIVNESGGPLEAERVRIDVGVAYGSDIDRVREVLTEVAAGSKHLLKLPAPRVRFRAFGDSSLNLQLLGWIERPVLRGRTIDELLTAIYKRFTAEGIVIPFPQRDVHVVRPPGETPSRPVDGDAPAAEL